MSPPAQATNPPVHHSDADRSCRHVPRLCARQRAWWWTAVSVACVGLLGLPECWGAVWKDDDVRVDGQKHLAHSVTLRFVANHRVLNSETKAGHFTLEIGGTDALTANTTCFEWHALDWEIQAQLPVGLVVNSSGGGHANSSFGYLRQFTALNSTATLQVRAHLGGGCDPVRTHGDWADAVNWREHQVPTESDEVVLGDAGFVALTDDVRVAGLTMNGSTVVLQRSSCPNGWTKPQHRQGHDANKCYAAYLGVEGPAAGERFGYFDTVDGRVEASNLRSAIAFGQYHFGKDPYGLTWTEAERFCELAAPGFNGHLARIRSHAENEVVHQLCEGTEVNATSPFVDYSREHQCWIGLRRETGANNADGPWAWEDEHDLQDAGSTSWRAWARKEPNNRTHVDGGEGCALMRSGVFDPELVSQGRWMDERCAARHPFVCERFAESEGFALTVAGPFRWYGGFLAGGGTLVVEGKTTVDPFAATLKGEATGLTDAARLELHGDSVWAFSETRSASIDAGDGTTIWNQRNMTVVGSATIRATAGATLSALADDGRGVQTDSSNQVRVTSPVFGGRRPRLVNHGVLAVAATEFDTAPEVEMSMFLDNQANGTVDVQAGELVLGGGGAVANGGVAVAEGAIVTVSDLALALAQVPQFDLSLTAPIPVTGEQSGYNAVESSDRTDADDDGTAGPPYSVGNYRLRVVMDGANGYKDAVTQCVPFHAPPKVLQQALEELGLVQEMGGVTVTRDGDALPGSFENGYRYKISFDALPERLGSLATSGLGPAALHFHCQGMEGCGCNDVYGPNEMIGDVRFFCPGGDQNSTKTNPDTCSVTPTIRTTLLVAGGEADVQGDGVLAFSGGVHRLPSIIGSGLAVGGDAAAFIAASNVTLRDVNITGRGILTVAGAAYEGQDNANLMFDEESGRLGRATLVRKPFTGVMSSLLLTQDGSLRLATNDFDSGFFARNVYLHSGELSGWGTVAAVDSLNITTDGTVTLSSAMRLTCAANATCAWSGGSLSLLDGAGVLNRGFFAVSALNEMVGALNPVYEHRTGQQWQDPYQWYSSPLCGLLCQTPGFWLNTGTLLMASGGYVQIFATFRTRGRVEIKEEGILELAGGGDAGGTGSFHVDGRLRLSGGSFTTERQTLFLNNGTIEVTAGAHQLADLLFPRLQIRGGSVEVRSRAQDLNGGLEIHDQGVLKYTVSNAEINVRSGNFTMTGGELRFTEVLAAAGIHPAHLTTDPRNADRSFMTVHTLLHWAGGKIRGNAELGAYGNVTMSGGVKRIEALAHLVNYEVTTWVSGDVIITEQANLVNSGVMELEDAKNFQASILYDGAFDGCCSYEDNKLHLWEDSFAFGGVAEMNQ